MHISDIIFAEERRILMKKSLAYKTVWVALVITTFLYCILAGPVYSKKLIELLGKNWSFLSVIFDNKYHTLPVLFAMCLTVTPLPALSRLIAASHFCLPFWIAFQMFGTATNKVTQSLQLYVEGLVLFGVLAFILLPLPHWSWQREQSAKLFSS